MNEKRLVVAVYGILVALVLGAVAYRFIEALTVSIFLYYSTRRFYRRLRRFRLPARLRAVIVMLFLAIPLLLLISYTVVLLVTELQRFVEQYGLIEVAAQNLGWLEGTDDIPELTFSGLYEAYQAGELDAIITFLSENAGFIASVVTGFFLNLFIATAVTYYLLIDGSRLRDWLLQFDDEAIIREYLDAADRELEAVLFGNLLNVIATSLIATGVYISYNLVAPAAVEVPYPTLAGVLTGLASLIPVVGIKIVYVPLAGVAAISAVVAGDTSLLVYVVGFLAVAIIVVDTIPDLVLRPFLSGENTRVGLLMLAYVLGPTVLGFYGLFFAPIVLVLGLTFADTALPNLLGAEEEEEEGFPRDQLRLDDF